VGIGEEKSSKMAHFVFKCNKEDYLSMAVYTAEDAYIMSRSIASRFSEEM
jgi:hypothetical protein